MSHCKDCKREYQRENLDKFHSSKRRYEKRLAQRPPESVYYQDESTTTKRCSKCESTKTLSEFHRDITKPDGYLYQCKGCKSEYGRQWYRKNADRAREYSKRSQRRKRRERFEYLSTHMQLCRLCGQKKPLLEFHRSKHHCILCNGATRDIVKSKLQRTKCQRIIRRYRKILNHKRRLYPDDMERDEQLPIVGDCTEEQLEQRCEYYGWRCYLCGQELDEDNISIDHRIPMSRGGHCYPANLAPVCLECNFSKGNKTTLEYVKWVILMERCRA